MDRFGRLAQLVGLNTIPVAGVFFRSWSDATAIAFYWCETALVVLFVSLRLIAHRRATNKRGHYVATETTTNRGPITRGITTYNKSFLTTTIAFGTGNLIFLTVILGFFRNKVGGGDVEIASLKDGLLAATALVGAGFAIDMHGLAERPFKWVRLMAEGATWRVFVIYLAIFIGLFAGMVFDLPHAMFAVFFALKLFTDVASNFKQYDPDRPPSWLRFVSKDPAFEQEWRTEKEARLKAQADDEKPFDGRPSTTSAVTAQRRRRHT